MARVDKVWNYLKVGQNENSSTIAKNAQTAEIIKSYLIRNNINIDNIKVIVSNKTAFLLGALPKKSISKLVITKIKKFKGVKKVVNLINKN